jgi:hypothetical protein
MRKMTDPISEWTLKECINALKRMDADLLEYGYAIYIADRIHDLTRWIPVSERMPTEEDGYFIKWWIDDDREIGEALAYFPQPEVGYYHTPPKGATHWQRITPPEGV